MMKRHWSAKDWIILAVIIVAAILLGVICGKLILDAMI